MSKNLAMVILTFLIAFFAAIFSQEAYALSEPPSKLLVGHQNAVLSVAFSPKGELLASAGGGDLKDSDNAIRIWDAVTGQLIKKLEGHAAKIFSVAFSPDGKFLASASGDGTIKIWDIATSKELRRLIGHNGVVYSISFSSDGLTLASGSADKSVRLWEVASGRELGIFGGHNKDVLSVAFSPFDGSIASGSEDRTIRIWSLKSGKEVGRYSGYKDSVWSVAYSPDGQFLAGASWDGSVRVWDVFGNQNQELRIFSGLGLFSPKSVSFNRDGKLLAVGLLDGVKTVKIWRLSDGKEVASFDSRPNSSLAFSSDGRRLAAGAIDGSVKLWETKADPPELLAPAENAVIDGKIVTLQWRVAVSALYYDLQISKNRDFTELVNFQSFLTKENLTYEAPPNQRLWWRVRSGAFGFPGDWPLPRSFTLGLPDEAACVVKVEIPNPKIILGEQLRVNIVAENVKNVAGFQLDLLFNPRVLQVKEVKEGKLLSLDGISVFWNKPAIDNQQGVISRIVATRLNPLGVGGSGPLVSIVFDSIGAGESEFIIRDMKLSSPLAAPITCIEAQGSIATVEGIIPPWDINHDGLVDVFDFVLVGQFLGKKPPEGLNFNPDVNGDGIVDVLDLVLVGAHFGERYQLKSPVSSLKPDYPDYSEYVPLLLKLLKQLQNAPSSPQIEHTKRILTDLIRRSKPKSNELLQNYPNPFNPETWIPYQLAQNAEVKIFIFDTAGKLIRKLDLGFKLAGFYTSPDMAAHWDGRTERGEPVASEVYFYAIQAGNQAAKFNAVRKMVMLK